MVGGVGGTSQNTTKTKGHFGQDIRVSLPSHFKLKSNKIDGEAVRVVHGDKTWVVKDELREGAR